MSFMHARMNLHVCAHIQCTFQCVHGIQGLHRAASIVAEYNGRREDTVTNTQ